MSLTRMPCACDKPHHNTHRNSGIMISHAEPKLGSDGTEAGTFVNKIQAWLSVVQLDKAYMRSNVGLWD